MVEAWDAAALDSLPAAGRSAQAVFVPYLFICLSHPIPSYLTYPMYPYVSYVSHVSCILFFQLYLLQVEPVSLDGVNWAFASKAEAVGAQAWKVSPPDYLPP